MKKFSLTRNQTGTFSSQQSTISTELQPNSYSCCEKLFVKLKNVKTMPQTLDQYWSTLVTLDCDKSEFWLASVSATFASFLRSPLKRRFFDARRSSASDFASASTSVNFRFEISAIGFGDRSRTEVPRNCSWPTQQRKFFRVSEDDSSPKILNKENVFWIKWSVWKYF